MRGYTWFVLDVGVLDIGKRMPGGDWEFNRMTKHDGEDDARETKGGAG